MKKEAVAYIRVSQLDYKNGKKIDKPQNQKLAIEEWAEKQGFEIVKFFVDDDVSGAVEPRSRKAYKEMLEFTRKNWIRYIIFYDVSRVGRKFEETLIELKKLSEEGYKFYFAGASFLNDIEDPLMKKKILADFAWFAELYREDIIRPVSYTHLTLPTKA